MSETITENIDRLLSRDGTRAFIATSNEDGTPHSVPSPFLSRDLNGRLVHLELLETSTTHRNILRSLWFDKPVSVTVYGEDESIFVIKSRIFKAHISGPEFSRHYLDVRSKLGDVDLAAVWLLDPFQVTEETYSVRKTREEELHPFFKHLDRLTVQPGKPYLDQKEK